MDEELDTVLKKKMKNRKTVGLDPLKFGRNENLTTYFNYERQFINKTQ